MTAEVLASGSSGNCTALTAGDKLLLVDCGKPFKWTMTKLDWRLPDALLVTHEHGDHSKAAKNFLDRGVDVFMTGGTAEALGLSRHNLRIIAAGETFSAAGVAVNAIPAVHDAAEPVNFILCDDSDRVLYVTDTGKPPDVEGDFTKIFIEANYSTLPLFVSDLNAAQKKRILNYHLSIEKTAKFLKRYPQAEVTLLHLSKRHGDAEEFTRRINAAKI